MNTASVGRTKKKSFSLVSLSYINFFLGRTSQILYLAFEVFWVWYKAKTNLDMKNTSYGQGVQGESLTALKKLRYLFNLKPAKPNCLQTKYIWVQKFARSDLAAGPVPKSPSVLQEQPLLNKNSGYYLKKTTTAKAPYCSLHFTLRASIINTFHLHIKAFFSSS